MRDRQREITQEEWDAAREAIHTLTLRFDQFAKRGDPLISAIRGCEVVPHDRLLSFRRCKRAYLSYIGELSEDQTHA